MMIDCLFVANRIPIEFASLTPISTRKPAANKICFIECEGTAVKYCWYDSQGLSDFTVSKQDINYSISDREVSVYSGL
ncbi:uncharacterized protein RAG0_08966 [Rhynchosporium agropyri]|nr:uncharacterized protein RAG0_08966 [Rhynchosporium agropyri]